MLKQQETPSAVSTSATPSRKSSRSRKKSSAALTSCKEKAVQSIPITFMGQPTPSLEASRPPAGHNHQESNFKQESRSFPPSSNSLGQIKEVVTRAHFVINEDTSQSVPNITLRETDDAASPSSAVVSTVFSRATIHSHACPQRDAASAERSITS